eukprot:190747-Pleurochrysis_carterae.AAC.2
MPHVFMFTRTRCTHSSLVVLKTAIRAHAITCSCMFAHHRCFLHSLICAGIQVARARARLAAEVTGPPLLVCLASTVEVVPGAPCLSASLSASDLPLCFASGDAATIEVKMRDGCDNALCSPDLARTLDEIAAQLVSARRGDDDAHADLNSAMRRSVPDAAQTKSHRRRHAAHQPTLSADAAGASRSSVNGGGVDPRPHCTTAASGAAPAASATVGSLHEGRCKALLASGQNGKEWLLKVRFVSAPFGEWRVRLESDALGCATSVGVLTIVAGALDAKRAVQHPSSNCREAFWQLWLCTSLALV